MGFTVYIPKDFDIDAFTIDDQPLSAKQKDKLASILSFVTLYTTGKYQAEKKKEEAIRPTGSIKMQEYVDDYNTYLDILLQQRIIILLQPYEIKKHANEYIINPELFGHYFATKAYEIEGPVLFGKYRDQHVKKQKLDIISFNLNNYGHLTRWFNRYLEIDFDSAETCLEEYYASGPFTGLREDKRAETISRYNSCITAVRRLQKQDWVFSKDSVGRFHTPLSNLKKNVRRFITYKGQHLCSLDMTNALPFLSTFIFDERFF